MSVIVLASSSRYRAALLRRLGIEFATAAPEIDEAARPEEDAGDLVIRLAATKARAVAGHHPAALVIGADQVAVHDARILGKPGTPDRARAQLASLSGHEVSFLTAVCLLNAATGNNQERVVETRVCFRRLTATEIAAYVEREQPLDCAGSFKSEGLGIVLFESVLGPDPTALIGLPLIALTAMLRNEGVGILD